MIMDTGTFLVLLTILLAVVAAFLVPLLFRLTRTVKAVEELADDVRQSIRPLAADLDETVKRLNSVLDTIEDSAGNVRRFTEPVGDMGREVARLVSAVRETEGYVSTVRVQVNAFRSGLRAALGALARGMTGKKDRD